MQTEQKKIPIPTLLYVFLVGGVLLCYPIIQACDNGSLYYPSILVITQMAAGIAGIVISKLWKEKGFLFMTALIVIQFVRIIVKGKDLVFSDTVSGSIFNGLWCVAGCYAVGKVLTKEQLRTFLRVIAALWTILTLVHCFTALYAAWTNQEISMFGNGLVWGITWYNRLLVGYAYPTTAGAVLSLSGMIALYAVMTETKTGIKIFYSIAFIIIISTLSMTDARTSIISLSVGTGAMVCFAMLKPDGRKRYSKKTWITAVICMVIAFAVVAIVTLKISAVFNAAKSNKISLIAIAKAETASRTIDARGLSGSDPLSGRTGVWKLIIRYITSDPKRLLIGESIYDPMAGINQLTDSTMGHCHNMLLQILLESGIIGLIPVLLFVFYTARNAFRIVNSKTTALWLKLIPAIPVSILVGDLAECFGWFFEWRIPVLPFLFISCGIINAIGSREENRIKINEKLAVQGE